MPGASTKPNQVVQIYHCHGYASDGANQRWKFWPNPGSARTIWQPG